MIEIVGRNEEKRERGEKTTQGHTETQREHVGTVQYAAVIDKRLGMHTAAVLMLEEETDVEHSDRNSHCKSMRHEA